MTSTPRDRGRSVSKRQLESSADWHASLIGRFNEACSHVTYSHRPAVPYSSPVIVHHADTVMPASSLATYSGVHHEGDCTCNYCNSTSITLDDCSHCRLSVINLAGSRPSLSLLQSSFLPFRLVDTAKHFDAIYTFPVTSLHTGSGKLLTCCQLVAADDKLS